MTFSSTRSIPFRRCDVSMDGFFFAVANSIAFETASCDLMVKLLKFMVVVAFYGVFVIRSLLFRTSDSSHQIVSQ
jgi:hypothetical protein